MRERAAEPNPIRCLACGARAATLWASATDQEYFTTDDEFRYLRCEACRTLSIDPLPSERLAEIYPPTYYSFVPKRNLALAVKHWLDRRRFRKLMRTIPGSSLAVLDVGGGAGRELDGVRASDPRISFTQIVDLDPGAAEEARRQGHAYHRGPIEGFETDRAFDLILLLNLIEHVVSPAAVLAKLKQLLSPTGLLLLKTPNYDSWDARLFRHRNWAGYHCPRHFTLFDRPGLTALIERCGLEVRAFGYTQGASFWSASVLAWLARRGLVRIGRARPVFDHPGYALLNLFFGALDCVRGPFAKTSQMFFVLGRPCHA